MRAARFNRDRDEAFELRDGDLKGALDLAAALDLVGVERAPAPRHKGALPTPTGYDRLRHQTTKALGPGAAADGGEQLRRQRVPAEVEAGPAGQRWMGHK